MSVRRAGAGRRTSALAKCGPTECELQPVLRGHRPRVRAVTGRSGRVRIMRCMSSFPSKKQIERELSILNTPTYMEAWESFVEYVRQLQDSRTATDLRMLQRELVFDVNGRQKALAAVVAEHAGEAKAKIEFLKAVEPRPKAELAGAQAILRGAKHVEEQPGVLAFHNDTTNCLRRGDITAVVEDAGRRWAIPKEVKAGRGSARKQVARIQQALEMIDSRRFLVPVPFETHLAEFAELIGEAKRTGYAKARFDCVFVQVIDYMRNAQRSTPSRSLAGVAV